MKDGLPSNIISAIAQDSHDFIWVGTGSGLSRFDGYHFKTFQKNESDHSLPSNNISALIAIDDYLWVGTWNGLCKINTRTFEITRIDLGTNNIIRALGKGNDNILWVGTATGLIRYSLADGSFKTYNAENNGLSHNTIRTIYEDSQGDVWVGTYDQLNKLPKGGNIFINYDLKKNYKPSLKNNLVLDIKPYNKTTDSLLWIGTETGLCLLDRASGDYTRYSEKNVDFSNEVIKCIYTDDEQNLWLGSDFGLNVFNAENKTNTSCFHNPQLSYSIANNVVWQIFEDKGGVIWFVTSNGLSRMNKYGNFYTYHEISQRIDGQSIGNQVKSMLITSKGIYWLATQHGAIRIDPEKNEHTLFDTNAPPGKRLLLNNVFALEEDNLGRVWIGTAGGINIWDESGAAMHAITASPSNGLTSNYIGKFTKGEDGSLWVSAWEGGLFQITGDLRDLGSIRFKLADDLGSEKHVAGKNAIWLVKYDELFRLDTETLQETHIGSFSKVSGKRNVYCLYHSRAGHLWAGVQNGLIEYDPANNKTALHPIITGNDIIISSIMEDNAGNIWGATNSALQKFNVVDHHTEVFPLDANIPLKSFFYGCAAKDREGKIIFGGDNGYIIFNPEKMEPNAYKPAVFITALEINNKTITADEKVNGKPLLQNDISFTNELTLAYAQRSFAFEFSSLHYWQPSMNVYAYKLEGFDKDWNYASGVKNFAVYSNLSPGTYTFIVRATNNYGIWSNATASMDVTVKPPLFLSRGFIVAYVLIFLALVYYALRTYSARVHLKNELKITRLEKEHAEEIERTKEQFFTNISHELRTPISLILPPIHQILNKGNLDEENKRLIMLAEKNSHRLLRLVNQVLDFKKLENDTLQLKVSQVNLVEFCHSVYELFSDKARRNEIDFTFHTGIETCQAWVDAEKMETLLFNLLSNAFKFTPKGGSITLNIEPLNKDNEFPDGALEISVVDSGIGIAQDELSKIFERFYQSDNGKKVDVGSGIGLTLAAEYVKLHHGTIQVESLLGKGTRFTVKLPLGNTHFPIDSVYDMGEVHLLATKSEYAHQEGAKPYHIDLESNKPLVLIIEDNNDMIDFIRVSLKQKYNFIVAGDGEEGLVKANNFIPDVIVSDIMMPVMDGLTLCRKIKASPKTSHIAIILLTAKGLPAQKTEGIRVGADAYITKPFEVDFLEANIDHLIQRKQELADYFQNHLILQPKAITSKENTDTKFVKRVMDIIEANISNPELSVEMISREVGMSTTHLYRKLKSLTQYSGNEIIKKYRIKKASLLLKNKEGNISEIMYDVGFSNLSYFSKCFKAEFGLTPKDYQQKTGANSISIENEIEPVPLQKPADG